MSMDNGGYDAVGAHEMGELVMRAFNGEVGAEEFVELDRRVREDGEAARQYVALAGICATLRQEGPRVFARVEGLLEGEGESGAVLREAIVEDAAVAEKEKLISRVQHLEEMRRLIEDVSTEGLRKYQEEEEAKQAAAARRRAARTRRLFLAVSVPLAACLALMVGVVLQHWLAATPGPVVVGSVEEALGARWADGGTAALVGTPLKAGSYLLEEGYVRVGLKTGADVILQAPVAFRLEEGNEVFLERVVLTARVSDEAVGFVVQTPTAAVVDYGTEFGVQAGESGRVDAYVFEGEVDLRVGEDALRHGETRRLEAGYRGAVRENGTLETGRIPVGYVPCVRALPRGEQFGQPGVRVDLADVVCGGNGFGTGRRGAGLEATTGAFVMQSFSGRRERGSVYSLVESLPLVDGVFVPDGGEGKQVVSSAGHMYHDCPDTNGYAWSEIISVGGPILYGTTGVRFEPRLGSVVFGGMDSPAIYMHSNAGITFDLSRLRDVLAGRSLVRFVADLGMCMAERQLRRADVAVLVDGEVRFSWKELSAADGMIPVEVWLGEEDRFLSLVVVNSVDSTELDFVLFGRPAIEMGRGPGYVESTRPDTMEVMAGYGEDQGV